MFMAFDHAGLTTEELIEQLNERGQICWDSTRHPLFDAMFVMQNMDIPPVQNGELSWEALDYRFTGAKLDLVLEAAERDGHLKLIFEYRSRLLPEEIIVQMAGNFLQLLDHAAAKPQETLQNLTGMLPSILPAAEKSESKPKVVKENEEELDLFEEDFTF
ncbi:Surfactin synthase subunit 2 [compost metagenome]